MTEMTIGIFIDPSDDTVSLKFHDVGGNVEQHHLAQYLHPKLLSIKQNVPSIDIKVHITHSEDLIVVFESVGDWNQRQKFEQFLYSWLPRAMENFEEAAE